MSTGKIDGLCDISYRRGVAEGEKRMREALKPFVDATWSPIEGTRAISMTVPIEAHRAARAAYQQSSSEEKKNG
jgi:hypothetical protein